MKKIVIGALAALAMTGIGIWQLGGSTNAAPSVAFTTLQNDAFTTENLRGKVVLVKFWATSCVTCVAQMPDAIQNYNDLSSKGFDIIAVAMDYDPPDYVKNFAESRKLPFKVVMDSNGAIARAFGDVKLTPTAFLIDKNGNIIKRYLGNYDKQDFLNTVNKALAS
ncbi:MAG: TlpA family protein disulfide reductase [Alcaligenaceae bacterium]|nr:TlpA family protein disulfide reductase [Alcaligenaceae bacterium]